MKLKILLITLILFSSNLFGQNITHPYYKSQAEFERLSELAKKTDSLIKNSDNSEYADKVITRGISEGTSEVTEIQTTDKNETTQPKKVGEGGFTIYTYIQDKTKQIIKAEYNQTVHYKYDVRDSLNANTERLEINIYYQNEKAYYAEFNENHYDDKKVISTNRFYFQLNTKREGIYYSNSFQEEIIKYIIELSEDIIAEK
jgi:hypothetical protein